MEQNETQIKDCVRRRTVASNSLKLKTSRGEVTPVVAALQGFVVSFGVACVVLFVRITKRLRKGAIQSRKVVLNGKY